MRKKGKKERGTNNKLNSVAFACQTVEFGCIWMPFICNKGDFNSMLANIELNSVAFTPNATEFNRLHPKSNRIAVLFIQHAFQCHLVTAIETLYIYNI